MVSGRFACLPTVFDTPGTGTGQTLNSPSDRLRGTVWGVFVTWGMTVDWLWFVVVGSRETLRDLETLSGKVGLALNGQSLSYRGHLVVFPAPSPRQQTPNPPTSPNRRGGEPGPCTRYLVLIPSFLPGPRIIIFHFTMLIGIADAGYLLDYQARFGRRWFSHD